MKVGDLVQVTKNDMAVIKREHFKDGQFFNKIGTITKVFNKENWPEHPHSWYEVLFSSGIYSVREDAIEVIS